MSRRDPLRRRRLGLRARVTLIYALGALLLTATMGASSYALTQRRLVSETERTAQAQLYRNVRDLRRGLQALPEIPADLPSDIQGTEETEDLDATSTTTAPPTTSRPSPVITLEANSLPDEVALTDAERVELANAASIVIDPSILFGITTTTIGPGGPLEPPEPEEPPPARNPITSILESLQRTNGAQSLLIIPPGPDGAVDSRQFSLSGLQSGGIPIDLRELVSAGTPAQRLFNDSNGEPKLAIGIKIDEYDVEYFELVPLTDLDDTLSSLRNILFGVALASSVAGAALGYYSARRAVQPLNRVSAAAQLIADGEFDTRLDDQVDPDLHRLATSFNHMVEALARRIERDEQFASDVSHELRSPLMTLTTSVGVLEGRYADLPAPAQQAVDLLGKDLRRFQDLVEDLLEISRMDAGSLQPELDPVFVREFLQLVLAQSRKTDIEVTCPPGDEGLLVLADKRRLAQVITNLLDNAAKYGGGATAVSFERRANINSVHIYVDDEGPGVKPSERTRIFDRFTRAGADAGRRDVAKGVGLGLSLVKEHVRLHNGQVWVTDRPDGVSGARFVVELPLDDTLFDQEEMAT